MGEKHKTTLLLDDAVWRRFQEEVLRQEGARATSSQVEKALAAMDPTPIVEAVATHLQPPTEGFPSVAEVEQQRPKGRGDMTRLIREDRDDRDDRVLGLERPRKKVQGRRRN